MAKRRERKCSSPRFPRATLLVPLLLVIVLLVISLGDSVVDAKADESTSSRHPSSSAPIDGVGRDSGVLGEEEEELSEFVDTSVETRTSSTSTKTISDDFEEYEDEEMEEMESSTVYVHKDGQGSRRVRGSSSGSRVRTTMHSVGVDEKSTLEEIPLRPVANDPRTWKERIGVLEMFTLTLLVLFAMNFFVGRSQNRARANSWIYAVGDLAEDQFFSSFSASQHSLISDGSSIFHYHASGRISCSECLCTLSTIHRQDIFHRFISLVTGQNDEITYEFLFDKNFDLPMTFAFSRRSNKASLKSSNSDISRFCVFEKAFFDKEFVLLTDALTAGETVVQQWAIEKQPHQLLDHLIDIVYSTHPEFTNGSKDERFSLRIRWKMGYDHDASAVDRYEFAASLRLLDLIANAVLSADVRSKCISRRELARREDEKEEREKREEERKKKKEEELNRLLTNDNLSEKAKRKLEEKEMKKKSKIKAPKTRMIMR